MTLFGDFGQNTIIKTEMSPNSIYLAEIVDSDHGATGGSTIVRINPQNRNRNIFFGVIKKNSIYIYSGKWGEFNDLNIRWETDEILFINEKKYVIE